MINGKGLPLLGHYSTRGTPKSGHVIQQQIQPSDEQKLQGEKSQGARGK